METTFTAGAGRLKRAAVLAATAVVALNVWTGSPLLALWVGSRVENASSSTGPSMRAIAAVVVVMALTSWLLLRLLNRLQDLYAKLIWFFFFSPSPIDQRSGR